MRSMFTYEYNSTIDLENEEDHPDVFTSIISTHRNSRGALDLLHSRNQSSYHVET